MIFAALAMALVCSSTFAQSAETRIRHGDIKSFNGSIMVNTTLRQNGESIDLFVADRHVISTNLLSLSISDAIRLRDMINEALKSAEGNYCKRADTAELRGNAQFQSRCVQSDASSNQKPN